MRKGTCIHFCGTHKPCEAGINIRELVGGPDFGWGTRTPCVKIGGFVSKRGDRVECALYLEPTKEQIDAWEAKMTEAAKRFEDALPLIERIKREHKGVNWSGAEPCPACCGFIVITHAAFNGHTHGQCQTDGCLNWME